MKIIKLLPCRDILAKRLRRLVFLVDKKHKVVYIKSAANRVAFFLYVVFIVVEVFVYYYARILQCIDISNAKI